MENLQIWDEILYEIERFSEVYRFQDLNEKRRGADLRSIAKCLKVGLKLQL